MNPLDVGGRSFGSRPGHVRGIKVFSGANHTERNCLGGQATNWLAENPDVRVLNTIVTQSSSAHFHCVTLTLLCDFADGDSLDPSSARRGESSGDVTAASPHPASSLPGRIVAAEGGSRVGDRALDRLRSVIRSGAAGVRSDLAKVLSMSSMDQDAFSAERVESAVAFLDRLIATCSAIEEEVRGAA